MFTPAVCKKLGDDLGADAALFATDFCVSRERGDTIGHSDKVEQGIAILWRSNRPAQRNGC